MILVLADDLTGAAEMAGEAFVHGFSVEIHAGAATDAGVDVLVIDTASRSLAEADARRAVERAMASAKPLQPAWMYKKVDSLLRGHVVEEIATLMTATGCDRTLLLPANPSLGRTIVDATYLVDGTPLHLTDLANDPEYPRHHSEVRSLLEIQQEVPYHHLAGVQVKPKIGINTADVTSFEDLLQYAESTGGGILPAGALEFFRTLLVSREQRKHSPAERPPGERSPSGKTLFVCGSAAGWRSGRGAEAARKNLPVSTVPDDLLKAPDSTQDLDNWVQQLQSAIDRAPGMLLAVGRDHHLSKPSADILTALLAETTTRLAKSGPIGRICAEGGGTATAIMRRLGWSSFRVSRHWADGVISLRPKEDVTVEFVVKVGSYTWPESVWEDVSTQE